MVIPLSIFYFLYLFLTALVLIFSLFSLYHVIRFGALNFQTLFASFIFIAGVLIILFFTFKNLEDINWQEPVFQTPTIIQEMPKIEMPNQ